MKKSDINPRPEYFDRYIDLVDDVELSEAFAENLARLEGLDRERLEKLGGRRYAPGKWTVKEILQHLIDWDRILAYRSLLFARRESIAPPGHDEAQFAANTNAEARSLDELLEELKAVNLATRAMFASFDDEALKNMGKNWNYEISVLAMGFVAVGHQRHHLKIIEDRYFRLEEEKNEAE